MTEKSLPDRPNLDFLKKEAKKLRNGARNGEYEALDRLRPYYHGVPQTGPMNGFSLLSAQFVIAREYGFGSWANLKRVVEDIRQNLQDKSSFQ